MKLIAKSYAEPRIRDPHTGRASMLPERASWLQWEIYQRNDGSYIRKERSASRWGGERAFGEWREVPIEALDLLRIKNAKVPA